MDRRHFLASLTGGMIASRLSSQARTRPNIVLIYADDVGYGDLSCYGATRVRTPNLDRLAGAGVRFTNAHSTSATCTPSRYSLLTGEYAWRKRGTNVLPGDANLVIEPDRGTLPAMLREHGYRTAVVGKWHLGMGKGKVDWNAEISPGPREVGFDYSFVMPATGDRVPCVYVENGRVVGLDPTDPIRIDYEKPIGDEPTGKKNPELLKMRPSHGHDMAIVNGVSRIGYMTGGTSALWVDEDMADTCAKKATAFIAQIKMRPFFLYFATHDIHVPRLPNKRFDGKTPIGPRGDAIAELDWTVGQVLGALDRNGLVRNTLVIFSSDNGPVVDDVTRMTQSRSSAIIVPPAHCGAASTASSMPARASRCSPAGPAASRPTRILRRWSARSTFTRPSAPSWAPNRPRAPRPTAWTNRPRSSARTERAAIGWSSTPAR